MLRGNPALFLHYSRHWYFKYGEAGYKMVDCICLQGVVYGETINAVNALTGEGKYFLAKNFITKDIIPFIDLSWLFLKHIWQTL